ncbi:MAG: DUF58 domain-containing protein [Spirochaetales bacterium]|nr:DUF58 domain-containing protein [Spirochaetales bacterium]
MSSTGDRATNRLLRRLKFASPMVSRSLASGEFRSAFKGRGVEFDSLRDYDGADDASLIDWNASARFGRPFVKTFRESRDLALFVVFDASASMDFGAPRSKRETAAAACGLLCLAAEEGGNPSGALVFAGSPIRFDPPASGRSRALALAERFASLRPDDDVAGSALCEALEATRADLKRRSIVVVASDFLASGWERPFAELSRRHDVIALRPVDPSDGALPPLAGACAVRDAESGRSVVIDPSSADWNQAREAALTERRLAWLRAVARARASRLEIGATEDPALAVLRFFDKRSRRPA